jgi:hypothetical protein
MRISAVDRILGWFGEERFYNPNSTIERQRIKKGLTLRQAFFDR